MNAEILTIGDEVLAGNIVDTNTAYLSDQLWQNGIDVTHHSSVRDVEADILAVFEVAVRRSHLVLVTGGLGPTEDDLTMAVAARFFRKKMVLHQGALDHIHTLYKKLGRKPVSSNNRQAMIPQGAKVFLNPVGTAPGVRVKFRNKLIYFLPGVPKEMKALFEKGIWPDILASIKRPRFFSSRLLKCFGEPESTLDRALSDLYTDKMSIDGVRVGFRVRYPETFIKLSAWDETPKKAVRQLKLVEKKVSQRIQGALYGADEDTLESVVGNLLTKNKQTLAVAESCTGGLIANRLTNISGSSAYFEGGVVSYSNAAKKKFLGVKDKTLKKYGAVSHECAREMAQGARKYFKSDFALAVSGIAGPQGGSKDKPVGTVYIALADRAGVKCKEFHFVRDREMFKLMVASVTLNWLRKRLLA